MFLKAFLARRSYAMRLGVGLRIVGSRYSEDATRLREFAARNRLPLAWIELEDDPDAEALLRRFGVRRSESPVTIWQGKDVLKNPTNAELARAIGIEVEAPRNRTCDLVVVGTGPAGLGASVYGASEGLSTLALESVALGGQAGHLVANRELPELPSGALRLRARQPRPGEGRRARRPTAGLLEAVGLGREDGHFRIDLSGGDGIGARSVVVATRDRYRRLEVPRLGRFEGESVHYAATQAEVQRCEGEEVAVVGDGNSAGQAALFLAGRTKKGLPAHEGRGRGQEHVPLSRRAGRGEGERRVAPEQRGSTPPGEERLEGVVVQDKRTGARRTLGANALFVFLARRPTLAG
jgi:thioredoxin reductase (NADPH)